MRAIAKTNGIPVGRPGHRSLSVRGHALDSAAAARRVASGRTLGALEAAAGRELSGIDIDRICVVVGLHDVGKCLLGFRRKLHPSAPRPPTPAFNDHCAPLVGLFDLHARPPRAALDFVSASGLSEALGWFGGGRAAHSALEVLFSHHGGPSVVTRSRGAALGVPFSSLLESFQGTDAGQEAAHVVDALRCAHPLAFRGSADAPPLPTTPQFLHLLCGLTMLADWLASTTEGTLRHELSGDAFVPTERNEAASVKASSMLSGSGFHSALAVRETRTAIEIVNAPSPRPLQAIIYGLPLDSRFVGLEAPTGEGKTEAAVIRFVLLYAAGLVDGMYFAVPTRSAGVSLRRRIAATIERLFPGSPLVAIAVPGAEIPLEDGRELPWSSERGRFLASGVAVGTVDQILLGGLRVKGAHQRMLSTARMLVVVDEVHSCDHYMATVLAGFLDAHVENGGHCLLLSATLGNATARLFGMAQQPLSQAALAPYPVAWHGRRMDALDIEPFLPDPSRDRTVNVSIRVRAEVLRQVASAVAAGAKVLVILSTVRDAIAFQRDLESLGVRTATALGADGREVRIMNHGRFAAVDRAVLDGRVELLFSPTAPVGLGVCCVGTQTIEQSLDIDADLLVTDLCPAEVMIQRWGREHRSRRKRPAGFEEPTVLVVDPGDLRRLVDTQGRVVPMGEGSGPALVYGNVAALQATLECLRVGRISMPGDCRRLVEASTHPEALREVAVRMGSNWVTHLEGLEDAEGGLVARARRASIRRDISPTADRNLLDGADEAGVRTRIGSDSVDVSVDFVSFLGNRVTSLSIRVGMLGGQADGGATVLERDDQRAVIEIGGRRFVYDRFGLNREGS